MHQKKLTNKHYGNIILSYIYLLKIVKVRKGEVNMPLLYLAKVNLNSKIFGCV